MAGPFSRRLFLSATPQTIRAHLGFASRQPAPELDSPHVDVELFSRNPDGHDIRVDPLVRTAAGQFPKIPGVVVINHRTGCNRKVKEPGCQLAVQKSQVSCVASQQASLPVRHAFSGGVAVSALRLCKKSENHTLAVNAPDTCNSRIFLGSFHAPGRRRPPPDSPGRSFHDGLQGSLRIFRLGSNHPEGSVLRPRRRIGLSRLDPVILRGLAAALINRLDKGRFHQHLSQTLGVEVEHLNSGPSLVRQGLSLGLSQGVQHQRKEIQGKHYPDRLPAWEGLQPPGNALSVPAKSVVGRLGTGEPALHVLHISDAADRVGVGVDLREVGRLVQVGIHKVDGGSHLPAAAKRLDEGIGNFNRYVDGPLSGTVGVQDHRNLRQPAHGPEGCRLQRLGQFDGNPAGTMGQDGLPDFGGELHSPRDHRQKAIAPLPPASPVFSDAHSGGPPGPGSAGWQSPGPGPCSARETFRSISWQIGRC